jgi:uncharacterized protein
MDSVLTDQAKKSCASIRRSVREGLMRLPNGRHAAKPPDRAHPSPRGDQNENPDPLTLAALTATRPPPATEPAHDAGALARNDTACAYIDLNAYPDLSGFAGAISSLTAKALETNTDRLLKMFSGFQRLRPKVTIDPDGNLSAALELAVGDKDALSALMEGMAHAESLAAKKGKKLVVIIDEFSDIEKYNGQTVEKALRSEIQKHGRIGYIFSGSEQSVMLSMIQDSQRAFYKLGRIMALGPIKRETYVKFILNWLKKGGYAIDAKGLMRILAIGENVP